MRLLLASVLALCTGGLHGQELLTEEVRIAAPGVADVPLRVRVYLPPGDRTADARYPVLYVNDGQDMEGVGLQATLRSLYDKPAIHPIIVIAIDMPPDRMGGYGLFDRSAGDPMPAQTRYGPVGMNAQAYARWVVQTLVPAIDARYRTIARREGRAMLGWSLGALSAFGIGWQYPEMFARVGAFSPSLWVSADRSDAAAIQDTRLVHRLVDAAAPMPRPELFFAVGTAEETDDRDGDGVIDVLDDTRDLLEGWQASNGMPRKGLHQLGYTIDPDQVRASGQPTAVLHLLDGGKHDQPSWARMLPVFLRWAYAEDLAQAARE